MTAVLAIAGSLRRDSYNRSLLRAATELSPPGMRILLDEELASIPPFDEDLERTTAGGPEPVRELRQKTSAADGLLIATPEYNHSFPGVLKNAIDWLSRPAPEEVLAGKPVAVIGASGGPWGTRLAQGALRQVLYATGSVVLPSPALFVKDAGRLFDGAGKLVDQATRERLEAVLLAFADWIDVLSTSGTGGTSRASRS
jgi:chromate reductase